MRNPARHMPGLTGFPAYALDFTGKERIITSKLYE